MSKPLRILLLGNGAGALDVARQLSRSNHRLELVYTNLRSNLNALGSFATGIGCQVYHEKEIRSDETVTRIRNSGIDVLLCIRSLYVVPAPVIDAVNLLALNLHSALLPVYAGRNTISWSIYNGETEHGATLHVMDKDVDTGDIVGQVRFPLEATDTGATVTRKTIRSAVPMVIQVLESLSTDGPAGVKRSPQDLRNRRYYLKEIPHQGWIPWNRPAVEIDRQLRASNFYPFPSPWGTPRTTQGGTELHLLRGTPIEGHVWGLQPGTVGTVDHQGALVATGDGWLRVETLLQDGERLDAYEHLLTGQLLCSPED